MKATKLILLPLALLLALTMASCGSDEPDVPRDRDFEMTVKALTHVLDQNTQQANLDADHTNRFSISPKNLMAQMELHATIDGAERTFSIQNVPLTVEPETSRYKFNLANTSDPAVTNLHGTIDRLDQVAIFQYDVAGCHVCVTIPDVFFSLVNTAFDYSDNTHSQCSISYWTLKTSPRDKTASLVINDIEIKYNLMNVTNKDGHKELKRSGIYFTAIIGHGTAMQITPTGFKLTATQLNTIATYGKEQQVAGAYETSDYPIRDLDATINLNDGTLNASYTVRHVLERDANGIPTQWDDMQATTTGNIYKTIILE